MSHIRILIRISQTDLWLGYVYANNQVSWEAVPLTEIRSAEVSDQSFRRSPIAWWVIFYLCVIAIVFPLIDIARVANFIWKLAETHVPVSNAPPPPGGSVIFFLSAMTVAGIAALAISSVVNIIKIDKKRQRHKAWHRLRIVTSQSTHEIFDPNDFSLRDLRHRILTARNLLLDRISMKEVHVNQHIANYGGGMVNGIIYGGDVSNHQMPSDPQLTIAELESRIAALQMPEANRTIIEQSINVIRRGGTADQRSVRQALHNIRNAVSTLGQTALPILEIVEQIAKLFGVK